MTKTWFVYRHTSPSGKVYIGVTTNIKERWGNGGKKYRGGTRFYYAIQKYGWDNFNHTILFSGLEREDAFQRERELINQYKSTNPKYGYNLQSGGINGEQTKETKQKISNSLRGHTVGNNVRNAISKARSCPIVCLETGVVYNSIKSASESLHLCETSIGKAVNGKQDVCGGLHFSKQCDLTTGKTTEFIHKEHCYNKVICITTGMIYSNISEASRDTGLSRRGISYACNGKHKTCGKYKWSFVNN